MLISEAIEQHYRFVWSKQKDGERSRGRAEAVLRFFWYPHCVGCEDCRSEDLQDYARNKEIQEVGPATINRHISAFLAAVNPHRKELLKFKWLKEPETLDRAPNRSEVSAILRELRKESQVSARLCRFLYRTGMRKGEALKIQYEDCATRADGVWIDLWDTKNGCHRRIPVPAACDAWIRNSPAYLKPFHHLYNPFPCL